MVAATVERDRLITEARVLMDEIVAFGESLTPEERMVPRTPEGWSLTDHLFHLAAWTRWAYEELHGRPGATELGMTAEEFTAVIPQYDVISARTHARFRGGTWNDAVVRFRTASFDLETFLRQATPEALNAPALWANSLNEVFHDFAIHHVGQHLGWMREQVAATTGNHA